MEAAKEMREELSARLIQVKRSSQIQLRRLERSQPPLCVVRILYNESQGMLQSSLLPLLVSCFL